MRKNEDMKRILIITTVCIIAVFIVPDLRATASTKRTLTWRPFHDYYNASGSYSNYISGINIGYERPNFDNTETFLEDLSQRCFSFFVDESNTNNGLITDRAKTDGSSASTIASIASVGFGLTAYCIGAERGWINRTQAYERVLTTLRMFWDGDVDNDGINDYNSFTNIHGFFYHFININTGNREWSCEVSSIDTTLLLAGILTARQYFDQPEEEEVRILASNIYHRVDWKWMQNGTAALPLSMGWKPEDGFISARWSSYSEHMVLHLLGIGSPNPENRLSPEVWDGWSRTKVVDYDGKTFVQCPPLFTHQFSHAWVDFYGKSDGYLDYWYNSKLATLAHRQFCIDQGYFYSTNVWGISASDYEHGYTAWGGPPAQGPIDGTVVPYAPAGSMPFTPEICIETLQYMYETFGSLTYINPVWSKYGFADAFRPSSSTQVDWVNDDVIGIDMGITLLMIENYRSGFVWEYFMRNPEIMKAMDWAGFQTTNLISNPGIESVYNNILAHWIKSGLQWRAGHKNYGDAHSGLWGAIFDVSSSSTGGTYKLTQSIDELRMDVGQYAGGLFSASVYQRVIKNDSGSSRSWLEVQCLATNDLILDTWSSLPKSNTYWNFENVMISSAAIPEGTESILMSAVVEVESPPDSGYHYHNFDDFILTAVIPEPAEVGLLISIIFFCVSLTRSLDLTG